MKIIEAPKNNYEDEDYYYSYDTLIDSFEVTVLLKVDEGGYQGDTRLLVQDGSRYGLITFGWGSCSGCDALEAAGGDIAEITKLRDLIWQGAHWEDSAKALLTYIESKDWSLDYSWNDEFLGKAKDILASTAAVHTAVGGATLEDLATPDTPGGRECDEVSHRGFC